MAKSTNAFVLFPPMHRASLCRNSSVARCHRITHTPRQPQRRMSDCIHWWGRWWPMERDLPFSGHWLSCTGCYQYLLNMKRLMYGIMLLQLSNSLGCFRPRTFFLKNGLDLFPWNSSISYLHTILSIMSMIVSGLGTVSPCGVRGRGWTTCLLCDGPILGLGF